MKRLIILTLFIISVTAAYAQNTSSTSPSSGDSTTRTRSTMDQGSGTLDSTSLGTSSSPGSGASTTIDDETALDENFDNDTDAGTGANRDDEFIDDQNVELEEAE